ncbi:hypothetical protein AB0J90_26540 [Micromonospora sp. NPDC049523]|uniref:hypothetical protein n=1 Tax=Micromonospora sp. NPDC049523 TaxID=3155921 RepID=UPI0034152D27
MIGTEIELAVGDVVLAGVDFGGQDAPVLLVHGSGHKAAAWADVAARLVAHSIRIHVEGAGPMPTGMDMSEILVRPTAASGRRSPRGR